MSSLSSLRWTKGDRESGGLGREEGEEEEEEDPWVGATWQEAQRNFFGMKL